MRKVNLAAYGRRILPYYRWATQALLLRDRVISHQIAENGQAIMRPEEAR
jgi:hypothetical protein